MKKSKKGLGKCSIAMGDDLHTYAAQKLSGKAVSYHASDSDYVEMIIEMVGKIEDERLLKYFYVFMSEKLKRVQ